jgi:hypothetical protein
MSYIRYNAYIRDVACERPLPPRPNTPEFGDAITALHNAFCTLFPADGGLLITRHGLDAALDVLFAHPQIAPLLLSLDPDTLGSQTVLPRAHPRYADFWTHIVRPAWDQYAEIQRTTEATGTTG